MKNINTTLLSKCFALSIIAWLIVGCTGQKTFSDFARAGDTIALAAGWQKDFNKNNITVTITPPVGADIVIPAGDPAIRAAVNIYPDPVSSIVASKITGKDQTIFAQLYGSLIDGITTNDPDWYQTTIMLDLPPTLPVGSSNINIINTQGQSIDSTIEVIAGAGSPHTFTADSATDVNGFMFRSLQRATNYEITFATGSVVPHAIEIELAHDADENNGGTGLAHAVNHIGYIKSLLWADDGLSMKAIIMPTSDVGTPTMDDFKFYVVGGINNLSITSIFACDINGVDITGITGALALHDI